MLAETAFARLGRDQGAGVVGGTDPAGRRESIEQSMPEAPGDVVALFGPIHAAVHRAPLQGALSLGGAGWSSR